RDSAGAVDDNPLPPSTDAPEPVNSPVKVGNDGGPSWYEEVLEARRERADAQARARAELLAARQVPAGQVPPGSVFAGGIGDVPLSRDLDGRQPVPHAPEALREGGGASVDDPGTGSTPAETNGDGGPRPSRSDGLGGEFDDLDAR